MTVDRPAACYQGRATSGDRFLALLGTTNPDRTDVQYGQFRSTKEDRPIAADASGATHPAATASGGAANLHRSRRR